MKFEEQDIENLRREAGIDILSRLNDLDDAVIQVMFARLCLFLASGNPFSLAHLESLARLEDEEMGRASREYLPELSRLRMR
jgi:hypothetical protein